MKHFKMLSPETKSQGNQASSQQNSIAKGKKCNTQEKFKAMTSAHAFVIYTRRKREEKEKKKKGRKTKSRWKLHLFLMLFGFWVFFIFSFENQISRRWKEKREKKRIKRRNEREEGIRMTQIVMALFPHISYHISESVESHKNWGVWRTRVSHKP